MRNFVLILAVLMISAGAARAAGKLDGQLAKAAPAAIDANLLRKQNVRAVRHAVRKLAARPDVRAVLSGGGEILLGAAPGAKTHVQAQVYKTSSPLLVLRGPAPGKRSPRLTLRSLTVEEGMGGIGFVQTPVLKRSMEDTGELTFAKGGTDDQKATFALAVRTFGLTPEAVGNAALITP